MRVSETPPTHTPLKPEFEARVTEIRDEINRLAKRMNPNVQVDVVERLFHEGPELVASGAATPARQEVAGLHWRARGLIEVSLAPQYNPLDTAAHELWHSVEPMLTPQEQATLQRAFPETDSLSHEERTAYAFETWKKRKGSKPGVPPIFRKVSLFMRGVRNWLRGQGVKKAEDIFDTAERGEVGRRDFGPLSEAAQSRKLRRLRWRGTGAPHPLRQVHDRGHRPGEGAQVYGHGLYFAEAKEGRRSTLSQGVARMDGRFEGDGRSALKNTASGTTAVGGAV